MCDPLTIQWFSINILWVIITAVFVVELKTIRVGGNFGNMEYYLWKEAFIRKGRIFVGH